MLRVNEAEQGEVIGKYKFLDNDFLSLLFYDEDLFVESLQFLGGNFLIDAFTKFEFLRDVFQPEIRTNKETFISNDRVFADAELHHEIFRSLHANTLLLSRLYAHKKKAGVSPVDLLLAAQLMRRSTSSVLVTGNKKDFPSFMFDTVTVMNYEQKDGSFKAISVVKFNSDKFASCQADYARMRSGA